VGVQPRVVPRIAPDPDDDVVDGTALAARASIIVTGDKPLLSVIRYQSIEIVVTALALQRVAA
jgi:predicted nucleic acid-binding protein